MNELSQLTWPAESLGRALEALGSGGGLTPRDVEAGSPSPSSARVGGESLGQWIESAARWLGLEAEPRPLRYTDVVRLARDTEAPTLVRVPGKGEPRFVALLSARKSSATLVCPDLTVQRVRSDEVAAMLCRTTEEPLAVEVGRLLEEIGVPQRRRARARSAILEQRLGPKWIAECWSLRNPPAASLWRRARQARLAPRLTLFFVAHVAQYALWLLSWWVIGQAALGGRAERGLLAAWVLLLMTTIPLRLVETWSSGLFAIGAGGLIKQRLLQGALKLEPEEIRHEGVGHLLGRVFEGDAVESLALSGGLLGLVAAVELLFGAWVLWVGAGGWLHVLLLAAWVALVITLGWVYYRRRLAWTESRLKLTHNLVEVMVGHRTRLAQEARERWHEGEDQSLENYLRLSAKMDRVSAQLAALVPRGWLVLGVAALAPAYASGEATAGSLAVGLGGILLVFRALGKLAESLASLAGAGVAWRKVAPLFESAARPDEAGVPSFSVSARRQAGDDAATRVEPEARAVAEAHDLVFRYRGREEPVLRGCSLRIDAGERLLLEGPSGGGKSTLASLLTGMRRPDSGLLLLGGLDRQTLGLDGWRRRVVSAPQFHENHVLTETFAFNLLMGRRWPPRVEDIAEAEAVCRELGLGELLGRMPGGFEQMVGESGWQLSHGERSRLFIARALLQRADLLVLDESFAALDPENLRLALTCVLNRAPALLVIAHP
ncbi:MAG: ATP-binding cassette, subfamily bacterial [Acidobacteriota bacterium]|jgi:ATP-binding cassette subfamily B protein|nr:ATP-binding cassette, subfamily bacterial [Acidobacteriota bacterium]